MKLYKTLSVLSAAVAGMGGVVARGDYEVPNSAYAPPTHYYDSAAGIGLTLRGNLHTIISTGFTVRSYGDSRYAMGTGDVGGSPSTGGMEDMDPNNPANILLVYNRASVSGKWDAGVTFNREHVWPKFLLGVTSSQVTNTYKGVASDAFELRPANPNINSSRNDNGYGFFPQTSTGAATHFGNVNSGGTTYWYPGDPDRGEVARIIFYMATRWFDPTNSSRGTGNDNLQIVNGAPSVYNFGDLNSLLHWNYSAGVDNFERRRNQMIYGSAGDLTNHALNPTYYQGNRNPYIDHPEYVWAIFGGGNNSSQISVGTADSAGASTSMVDLGRVIQGATISSTGSVQISKTGATPTTYDVTTSGGATASAAGTGQPFDYGSVTRTTTVGLSASTATFGIKSGTVTINNTDLTTGGGGLGSADGNDVITVQETVVDHSNASLAAGSDVNSQAIDFGYVPQGFASRTAGVAVTNLVAASGFTANLSVTGVSATGSTASLSTNATAFSGLAGGGSTAFTATLNTNSAGALATTQTLATSDEAIPGATTGAALTVNLSARVISAASFPVSGFIQLNNGETYNTGAFSIAGGVTLTKTGAGTMNVTGVQSNGAGSGLVVNAGTTNFDTDAGAAATMNLAVSASGAAATVNFDSTQHLAALAVSSGAAATISGGGGKVIVTNGLTLNGAALDVNDNDVVVNYASVSPAGTIRGYLISGYNGGAWNGAGIDSTSAHTDASAMTGVGYVEATDLGYTSFDGETIAVNAVLVKYTYYGDSSLDGNVDLGNDFNLFLDGFVGGGTNWVDGDYNYDGHVDMSDFMMFIDGYAGQGGSLGVLETFLASDSEMTSGQRAALLAVVPEPGSAAVMAIGLWAVAIPGRRRRR